MRGIAKKCAPIHVVVHYPTIAKSKCEAERVASVHADMIIQRIKLLNCPAGQELQLLDGIIQPAFKKENTTFFSAMKYRKNMRVRLFLIINFL